MKENRKLLVQRKLTFEQSQELIDASSTGMIEDINLLCSSDERFWRKTGIYDAVRDRLSTVFLGYNNPAGTK